MIEEEIEKSIPTLSHDRASRDAVRDFAETGVQVKHLCWRRLIMWLSQPS